ncbi:MAG: SDR family NAD(P)-dependent oxidoreductase [Alphaproteobacteria bacterium]
MSKPILVTGAAGFIGFHTSLRLLNSGKCVVGIDNLNDYYDVTLKQARLKELEKFDNFTFVKMDIADNSAMQNLWENKGPFTRVIHLAAQAGVRYSLENPHAYINSNIIGHLNIIESCRHTKDFEHLVYASSSSVYGGNKKSPFSVKDRVDNPVSLYAATKKSDELMSHAYSHLFNIPQTGLRFFTVYGPWGRPDMALFIFTKAICENKPLPVFNNGDMKRDFTYIDDIVSGIIGVLEVPPNKDNGEAPSRVLNIGNNNSEDLMDFVRLIEKELGQKSEIDFQPIQAGDVRETCADITETTAITGYQPTTNITEGIPKFIKWYKEYYLNN